MVINSVFAFEVTLNRRYRGWLQWEGPPRTSQELYFWGSCEVGNVVAAPSFILVLVGLRKQISLSSWKVEQPSAGCFREISAQIQHNCFTLTHPTSRAGANAQLIWDVLRLPPMLRCARFLSYLVGAGVIKDPILGRMSSPSLLVLWC